MSNEAPCQNLVGMYFLGNRRRGQIVEKLSQDLWLVDLISWIDGRRDKSLIVTLQEMQEWEFFRSDVELALTLRSRRRGDSDPHVLDERDDAFSEVEDSPIPDAMSEFMSDRRLRRNSSKAENTPTREIVIDSHIEEFAPSNPTELDVHVSQLREMRIGKQWDLGKELLTIEKTESWKILTDRDNLPYKSFEDFCNRAIGITFRHACSLIGLSVSFTKAQFEQIGVAKLLYIHRATRNSTKETRDVLIKKASEGISTKELRKLIEGKTSKQIEENVGLRSKRRPKSSRQIRRGYVAIRGSSWFYFLKCQNSKISIKLGSNAMDRKEALSRAKIALKKLEQTEEFKR